MIVAAKSLPYESKNFTTDSIHAEAAGGNARHQELAEINNAKWIFMDVSEARRQFLMLVNDARDSAVTGCSWAWTP